MNSVTAIILAGGVAKRFGGKVVKNLLEVEGKPLIARTVALLQERRIKTVILVRDPAPYMKAGIDPTLLVRTTDRWQSEGVLVSRKYWGKDRTLILFGDAYYADGFIDLLLEGETMFYCGTAEIWGMSVAEKWYTRLVKTAKKVVDYQVAHPAIGENLWRLYYAWYKQPMLGLPKQKRTPGLAFKKAGTVIMVEDGTVDFDFPKEYKNWCRGLRGRQVKAPHRAPICEGRKVVRFIPGTDTWRCPITDKTYRGFAHCEPKGCRYHIPQKLGE